MSPSFDLSYKTIRTNAANRQNVINEVYGQGWRFVRQDNHIDGRISLVFWKMIPIKAANL
jgi:hypothetical protein